MTSSLESSVRQPIIGSGQLNSMVISNILSDLTGEQKKERISNDAVGAKVMQAIALCEEEKKQEWSYRLPKAVLAGIHYFTDFSFMVASRTPATIPVAVTTYAMGQALSVGRKYVEKVANDGIKKKCAAEVARYSREHGLDALKESTNADLPLDLPARGRERYQTIFGEASDPFRSIGLEHKTNQSSLMTTQSIVSSMGLLDDEALEAFAREGEEYIGDLQNIEQSVVSSTQTLLTFAKKTSDRMGAMQSSMSKVQEGIQVMNEAIERTNSDVTQNKANIDFLQKMTFGKMSPEEQLVALNNSAFLPNISGEDREKLKESIAEQKKLADEEAEWQANMASVRGYAEAGAELVGLARTFGIEVPGEVDHGLNAVMAFSSGNYIGTVNAAAKMLGFGGKQKDIQGERHKEVMAGIGQILQGQAVMHEQLNKVLDYNRYIAEQTNTILEHTAALAEGQIQILNDLSSMNNTMQKSLENQATIMEAIANVSKQIQTYHEALAARLKVIAGQIILNRGAIIDGREGALFQCVTAIDGGSNPNQSGLTSFKGFLPQSNQFKSYESMKEYFNAYQIFLNPGLQALLREVSNVGTVDSIFLLSNEETFQQQTVAPFVHYYRDLWQFAKSLISDDDLNILLASTLLIVETPEALKNKINELRASSAEDRFLPHIHKLMTRTQNPPSADQLLKEIYFSDRVTLIAECVRRFHYFLGIRNAAGDFYTLEDLASVGNNIAGETLLWDMLARIDIAVAQQNIRTGDFLLPLFYEIMKQGAVGDNTEKYQKLTELLSQGVILPRNLVLYGISEDIRQRGVSLMQYLDAVSAVTPERLKAITSPGWQFVYADNLWHACFNEVKIPLPKPKQLHTGLFFLPADMNMLLESREAIMSEIKKSNFPHRENLSEAQRELYMRATYYAEH